MIEKFDLTIVVLPMKFISLGCIMVMIKSEILLYINTTHCFSFLLTQNMISSSWNNNDVQNKTITEEFRNSDLSFSYFRSKLD